MKQGPEILLIDFGDDVAEILRGRRYFCARGTASVKVRTSDPNAPFKVISEQSLPPVYEQEVILYDAPKAATAGAMTEPEVKKIDDAYPFQYSAVEKWVGDGGIVVVFVNSNTGKDELAWLPVRMNLDSIPSDSKFAAADDKLFGAFAKDFLDVMKFSVKITDASGAQTIARNLSGDQVACYFTRGKGLIVILPDFEDKAAVLLRLLDKELRDFNGAVFAGHTKTSWLDADTYTFPPYWKQREELAAMRKDFEQKLKEKEAQMEAALEERTPFLGLVSASETATGVPPFSQVVAKTMEFLGYDLKEKQVDAARRPKTARGTLLAGKSVDGKAHIVASVIATPGEPEINDYINLLGAVTDHIRETGDAQARGIILYNSQLEVPTAERREPFTGNEDILENLKTQNAAVLTGWTLFKLVQDIKGGSLTKEEARRELEASGLVGHASKSLKGEGEPKAGAAAPAVTIPQVKPAAPPPEPVRKVEPIRIETPPPEPVKAPEPPKVEEKPPEPPAVELKPPAAAAPAPEPPRAEPVAPPAPKLDIKPPEPIKIDIPKPAAPAPEAPKVEPPVIEVKPPEAPKVEPPVIEVKPPEAPKVEPPKIEIKPPEPPKIEVKPPEAPKVEPPKVEVKPAEPPKAEPPKIEWKTPEAPAAAAPTTPMPAAAPKAPEPVRAEAPKPAEEKKEPPKDQPPKGKMDYNKVVRKLLKWE